MRRSHAFTLAHWSLAFAASFAVHAAVIWLLVQGYHSAPRGAVAALQISLVTAPGQAPAATIPRPEPASDAPATSVPDGGVESIDPASVAPAPQGIAHARVALSRPQLAVADLAPQPHQPLGRQPIAAESPAPRAATASNATTAAQMEWQVASWLERYRTYPRAARRAGYEGTAWVRFTLDRRGRLQRSELVDSSGYGMLDRAAMELLDRASPFPALPSASGLDEIELLLPIEYRLMAAVGG